MQLKSLDKYIKDKVQGYKPPFEEDLWKSLEKKLPPPRVPNGIGSWMLPVAAIVAIVVLTPFTIKFYNLTGKTQEVMAKVGKINNVQMAAQPKNDDVIASPQVSLNSNPDISASGNKASGNIAGNSKIATFSRVHRHSDFRKISGAKGNFGLAIENQQPSLQKQPDGAGVEIAMNKQLSGQELMEYISPGNSMIESISNDGIAQKSNSRYPDRKSQHPLKNDKWENWQSIYYPFWNNPAYTGSEGTLNITGNVNTDNISEPSTQFTQTNIGAEVNFSGIGLGVGAYRLSELSPSSLQSTLGISVSKAILQIGSTSVKIGASGTMINNNLFFSRLNYSDQINPVFGFINPTSEKNIAGTISTYGLNGGLWISNPHVMAGLDVTNINQPRTGFTSDAAVLPRQYRALGGYRFAVGSNFQFMPMAILTRENKLNQANAMLTVVYKDNFMLSVAYQNIDPVSGLGNAYIYGAVNVAKRIRVFASYGQDMALQQMGINETFVHTGIKVLAIR